MEYPMKLHESRDDFKELINFLSESHGYNPIILEKDYWVTYLLYLIANHDTYKDAVVFKGGTALSKCHGLIHRFSEDIDLCVYQNALPSKNQINKIVKKIHEIAPQSLFEAKYVGNVERDQNRIRKHEMKFIPLGLTGSYSAGGDHDKVLLEINQIASPTPFSLQRVQSLIYEGIIKAKQPDLIDQYERHPFEMNVMDLERTYCEKISGVARSCSTTKSEAYRIKRIRHFYDLHLIHQRIGNTFLHSPKFEVLMTEVMMDDYKGSEESRRMYRDNLIITDLGKIQSDITQAWHNSFPELLFQDALLPSLNVVLNDCQTCIKKAAEIELTKYP